MWRYAGLVVGLVAMCAALVACGGGGGGDRSQACPIGSHTTFAQSLPAVSLDEARRRAQFGLTLPEALPADVSLSSVVIEPDPGCPDKRIMMAQLAFSGTGYSFTIWEQGGGPGILQDSEPIQINGVEGQVTRRTSKGERRVTVAWSDGKRSYTASAALTGGLTEAQVLQILESIPE